MSSIGVYSSPEKCGTRRARDFYPTPWEATEALCRVELPKFQPFFVWEPAAGDGAISRVLHAHGCTVLSTDISKRKGVFGHGGVDFLKPSEYDAVAMRGPLAIITNPPFNRAEAFIRRAAGLEAVYVAMLLKADFFQARKRNALFTDLPPARIYPLSWRLDFTGAGAPHTNCCWFVWDMAPAHTVKTRYMPPLAKPEQAGGVRV